MKVAIAMVMSADGKTTNGDRPGAEHWASKEDQQFFFGKLYSMHDCIIMGSQTFEAARSLIRPTAAKPRIILTRHPERYAVEAKTPGLIFTSDLPEQVIAWAADKGFQAALLIGGAQTNAHFLSRGLVQELYLTIEPKLFGAGLPLIAPVPSTITLKLLDSAQLNEQGTMLLHYKIVKDV